MVTVLRRPIGATLSRGIIRRLKAGPLEVEFDQELAEVRQELSNSPELAEADVPALVNDGLRDDLTRLMEVSPGAAVFQAFARIEIRLAELLDANHQFAVKYQSIRQMTRRARELDLISDETRAAVEGLAVLRDLAAHSPQDEISVARASDYIALADAVLFALRAKPPDG